MAARTAALAVLALLALPVSAEPTRWKFKPGQTFTYECRSQFHFATFQLNARNKPPEGLRDGVESTVPDTTDWDKQLDEIRRREIREALASETDPGRRAALTALLNKQGLITTQEVMELGVDPQWETVTLNLLVLAVGDDGSARVRFTVDAVRIETRFDDDGCHAEWDSRKSKTTAFAGFKPYEAMVGHTFEVLVAADGKIREMNRNAWPAPAPVGDQKELPKRQARAANATHLPTPAKTWLAMIFTIMPTGDDQWQRTVELPESEVVSLRADAPELSNGYRCVRSKLRSRDREHAVDVRKLAEMRDADLALRMCRESQKLGQSWFSPIAGCTVKAEVKSSTEAAGGARIVVGDFQMEIEIKDRGLEDLGPAPVTETGK
ncbi:MAG: hypothetical protein HYY18_04775 [Planctomycetes bacterium]|nr:hypothetical protein [Planctomycetota bacterium]